MCMCTCSTQPEISEAPLVLLVGILAASQTSFLVFSLILGGYLLGNVILCHIFFIYWILSSLCSMIYPNALEIFLLRNSSELLEAGEINMALWGTNTTIYRFDSCPVWFLDSRSDQYLFEGQRYIICFRGDASEWSTPQSIHIRNIFSNLQYSLFEEDDEIGDVASATETPRITDCLKYFLVRIQI